MKVIITESQLKYLIAEQAAQKIKVTDFCGRTKEVDYQQWYYGGGQTVASYVKCYKWDGTSYKYTDWGCEFRNWSTMTEDQRKTAIEGKKQTAGCGSADRYGVVAATQKTIQSFAAWFPQTIQEWVDWITWFLESFGGPQGKAIATMAEAIQGVGYLMFAESQKTLKGYVQYVIEGVSKLFSVMDIKIKIPGISDWLDRIVKYVESTGFGTIISSLTAKGAKINNTFDKQPKWIQAVITLLVQTAGSYVSQGLNWIVNNMITPLYNLIYQYNSTLAEYIKSFIDYLNMFSSLVDTASLIVTDLNEKGILTKVATK